MKAEVDKNVEIMDLLDLVSLGNFTLKEIVRLIIIVIIVCGGFAIVTSLIGGIGAFFALRIFLIVVSLPLFHIPLFSYVIVSLTLYFGKFVIIAW